MKLKKNTCIIQERGNQWNINKNTIIKTFKAVAWFQFKKNTCMIQKMGNQWNINKNTIIKTFKAVAWFQFKKNTCMIQKMGNQWNINKNTSIKTFKAVTWFQFKKKQYLTPGICHQLNINKQTLSTISKLVKQGVVQIQGFVGRSSDTDHITVGACGPGVKRAYQYFIQLLSLTPGLGEVLNPTVQAVVWATLPYAIVFVAVAGGLYYFWPRSSGPASDGDTEGLDSPNVLDTAQDGLTGLPGVTDTISVVPEATMVSLRDMFKLKTNIGEIDLLSRIPSVNLSDTLDNMASNMEIAKANSATLDKMAHNLAEVLNREPVNGVVPFRTLRDVLIELAEFADDCEDFIEFLNQERPGFEIVGLNGTIVEFYNPLFNLSAALQGPNTLAALDTVALLEASPLGHLF